MGTIMPGMFLKVINPIEQYTPTGLRFFIVQACFLFQSIFLYFGIQHNRNCLILQIKFLWILPSFVGRQIK